MNSRTWDFLRGHHQWITLFISGCLFISSLLMYTAEGAYQPEETEIIQEQEVEKTVELDIDGVALTVKTYGETVGDVISELGISMAEDSVVTPAADTLLVNTEIVEILGVTKESKLEVDEMVEGTEKVEKPADNTRVTAMGGDRIVTKDGISFSYTKVLDNAELTAYSAGIEHTGKNPGDPWYGMTYTGTQVHEGRTIAVDPKVIPLGWWVYIDGYGFRRAEDTGSAVKNNRLDIYFDNNDFVHSFGLKRGVKVWVIGPNDPRQ